MINVTLTINGVPTEKQLPTNWDDVSWAQFVDLNEIGFGIGYEAYYARYFLGLKDGDTAKINIEKHPPVMHLLNFLCYPQQMLTKPVSSQVNINSESWEKLERAKAAMTVSSGNKLKCGAEIVKVYTDEDITHQPITYALPLADFFFFRLKRFLKIMQSLTRIRRR